MAFPSLSKHKLVSSSLLCTIIIFSSYSGCVAEDNNPVQMFSKALTCFNNKFIYSGCEEPYRLDQSGSFKVPTESLNSFCNGPCLTETQLVLNCVDNIVSNFLFDNKATVRDIRGAVNMGCSYGNRYRGLFNFGGLYGDLSDAERLRNGSSIFFCMLSLIAWCCFHLML